MALTEIVGKFVSLKQPYLYADEEENVKFSIILIEDKTKTEVCIKYDAYNHHLYSLIKPKLKEPVRLRLQIEDKFSPTEREAYIGKGIIRIES